jgi:hypothetical protein
MAARLIAVEQLDQSQLLYCPGAVAALPPAWRRDRGPIEAG